MWEPFREVTEERQTELLGECSSRKPPKPPSGAAPTPSDMYNRVEKRIRNMLKKVVDSKFLMDVESRVEQLLLGSEDVLVFELESSYHRLLAHGVAQYYGLVSYSETKENGVRVTCMRLPMSSSWTLIEQERSSDDEAEEKPPV